MEVDEVEVMKTMSTKKLQRYLYGLLSFSFAFFSLRFRLSRTKGRSRSRRSRSDEDDVDEEIAKVSVWIA